MRPRKPDSEVRRNLSKRWYSMVSRCTNPAHPRYDKYGGVGVSVCDSWTDKEKFLEDAKSLPGFDEERLLSGNLHLDKDSLIPGNKTYSPESCVFVDIVVNNKHKPNQMKPFIAVSPSGREHLVNNQSEFAIGYGLRQGTVSACLKGKIGKHQGWTFRYTE